MLTVRQRFPPRLLILPVVIGCVMHPAAQPDVPPLPPGASLAATRPAEEPPLNYAADALDIAWTHPLLHAELEAAPVYQTASPVEEVMENPPRWSELELRRPGGLRIQLLEPPDSAEAARQLPALDLDRETPPEALQYWRGLCASGAHVLLPVLPLPFYIVPATPDPFQTPPWTDAAAGEQASVRWTGLCHQAEAELPEFDFRERLLISISRPRECETRFMLIRRTDSAPGRTGDLKTWLSRQGRPTDRLTLHGSGPQMRIGMDGWRLGEAGNPRREERLGVALTLRPLAAEEPADWMRLPGLKLVADSFEAEYPPAAVASGRLWPEPAAPSLWQSRPARDGRPADHWLEAEFTQPRPVTRIELLDQRTAGWVLPHPARWRLLGTESRDAAFEKLAEGAGADGQPAWESRQPRLFKKLRVEFPAADNAAGPDGRARLAGLQAWGPWDGKTGAPR